jgi:hypothetical protein
LKTKIFRVNSHDEQDMFDVRPYE